MAPDQIRVSGTALKVFSYGGGTVGKAFPPVLPGQDANPNKNPECWWWRHWAAHGTPSQTTMPRIIANNEQCWQCCKMQPFQLFTYYCLPVSPVWWHHQQWTTLAMLQNATFPAIYLWLSVHSLLFGGISHTRTDVSLVLPLKKFQCWSDWWPLLPVPWRSCVLICSNSLKPSLAGRWTRDV